LQSIITDKPSTVDILSEFNGMKITKYFYKSPIRLTKKESSITSNKLSTVKNLP